MKKELLEIACFNFKSAIIAQQNGADRVELCFDMNLGGISPSLDMVETVRAALYIDLYVMVRPRGGDFVYSEEEFEQMKNEIKQFKKRNVDGLVFGILNKDGSIDKERNKELVALAHPLPCTFHRAFDVVKNVNQSLESVIECGFKTILTSGQQKNVVEGIAVLAELVNKADNRIAIMPGGGLRSTNIKSLKEKTGAGFYHSSAIVDFGEIANTKEVNLLKSNLV
ncbi:copper homeostasis protein CutC [Flavobacterium sp.]|uniref:copper homeostasis protein CutC n=1 Tax=Flavobacterium sp. TaxID=239 RepID=UPI0025C4DBE6|nr:copper homeostasis protein CutC [Flavobacterium sp.]MBA4275942.1 copper homeostasis protein CutC [Flavobacterium sp.]